MNRLGWSLVCALALVACDGGDNGTDDAGSSAHDSGGSTRDSGPETASPVQAVLLDAEGNVTGMEPADFSCRGSGVAPTGSADATFTVTATDFQSHAAIEGLMIQFFPDNMPTADGSCTGSCQAFTTDSSGHAMVTAAAGSWYAYRVLPGTGLSDGTPHDFIGSVQVNETAPADGGSATLNVVMESTRTLILMLLPLNQDEASAVVTGTIVDCMGRQVTNAMVRVFDANGEISLGFTTNGPRAFYFQPTGDLDLPSGRQQWTNTDGLYGAANIPVPADNDVRVELWGSLSEGGTPEMLGCEHVQVTEDGLTIINIGPTRSDGPTDCSSN